MCVLWTPLNEVRNNVVGTTDYPLTYWIPMHILGPLLKGRKAISKQTREYLDQEDVQSKINDIANILVEKRRNRGGNDSNGGRDCIMERGTNAKSATARGLTGNTIRVERCKGIFWTNTATNFRDGIIQRWNEPLMRVVSGFLKPSAYPVVFKRV